MDALAQVPRRQKELEEQSSPVSVGRPLSGSASQDLLADDRKQAVDYAEKAVKVLDLPRSKGTPMPKELREAKVFLAEMYAEGNDAKRAIGVYQDLVDDILADSNTKSLDETTLRVFNGAVQTYFQLGNVEKASSVGVKLLELGQDDENVNRDIINFAKRLELARKQAAAASEAGNTSGVNQQAIADLETKILVALAKRNKLARNDLLPGTMVWIVQVLSKLDSDEADTAAAELVNKIFELRGRRQPIRSASHQGQGLPANLGRQPPGQTRQLQGGDRPDQRPYRAVPQGPGPADVAGTDL